MKKSKSTSNEIKTRSRLLDAIWKAMEGQKADKRRVDETAAIAKQREKVRKEKIKRAKNKPSMLYRIRTNF